MAPKDCNGAFPHLTDEELAMLRPMAQEQTFRDGQVVFKAGDADIDFFVVEEGALRIINPSDDHRTITDHEPGGFSGDIDLLTRRPVIVTAVAHGTTKLLRIPGSHLRELLNRVPRMGEKLITAFQVRREMLSQAGILGLKVVGPGHCRDTTVVREFLYKNFVPFVWYDTETPQGKRELVRLNSPRKTPAIECGDGRVLENPPLRELAECAGIWRHCPSREVELTVVGAGPAGMAAAVYAASEGISTLVLDRVGPGGQAGGSSRIENFIGFPAGLSGAELATRGVLQMLKFGAHMVAPVDVERIDLVTSPKEPHQLHLDCGATISSNIILLATGVRWRKLEVPGCELFERQGIYYACTSVEGLLHKGEDVVVIGGGNSAGQATMYLAEYCARKVHLLIRRGQFSASMSEYLADRIQRAENVEIHTDVEVSAVLGERRVEGVELRHKDGGTSRLPSTAVFVFIGADPYAAWLPDGLARDRLGYLLTGAEVLQAGRWPLKDREPCPLETSIPGILAAGDVRAASTKRVGFAVGDGSLAVTCVHKLRASRA